MDFQKVIDTAILKAEMNIDAIELPPGEYTVILEPPAVAEILSFASYMGFGALSFIEGKSFLVGEIDTQLFDPKIDIVDDPFHPLNPGQPFDFEGTPKQKLTLVEKGIPKHLAHDRLTAAKMKTKTTGHSLPQPNAWGPMPWNVVVKAGKSSIDDMIKSTERGLLVTHFHYTNVVEPRKLVLTGMTRDGLFLIENGKITKPVKNFRYTQNIPKALANVDMVGKELKTDGFITAPALKLPRFNFSSGTQF